MLDSGNTMEVVRRQFRHGDPAMPLRHATRDALRESTGDAIDAAWMDDVMLVISELVQNVTQHTHSGGELIVSVEPGTVLVEVGDTDTTVPQTQRAGADGAGGRGLMLVEALTRQWGVRGCPSGKVVWAAVPTVTAPLDAVEPLLA